jgi:hypothetical protein
MLAYADVFWQALAHYEAAKEMGDLQSSFNVAWALVVGPGVRVMRYADVC